HSSSLTASAYISFYATPDPRHLHSFPTRRSSDLPPRGCRPKSAGNALDNSDLDHSASMAPHSQRRVNRRTILDLSAAATPCSLRDRKSTRLNSSHRTISYAVFCLKKKINNKTIKT